MATATGERRADIDALRGLAVLLMVMVHLAATATPSSASRTSWLAYVVAGLGGLAAPLFVVLAGWAAASRPRPPSSRMRRAGLLLACQVVVNLSAPHLYGPLTPGVLSLFALLALLPTASTSPAVQRATHWTFVAASLVLILALPAWQGPSSWSARVETAGFTDVLQHLLVSGLYPLFPWVLLALLGHRLRAHGPSTLPLRLLLLAGLLSSAAALVLSLQSGRAWAAPTSPEGEAFLVFFPANGAFLLAACSGVLILWRSAPLLSNVPGMAALGQVSLSVYVFHTPVLFVLHRMEPAGGWAAGWSAVLVVAGTLVWWPMAALWVKHARERSLEGLMRRWS